MGSFIHQYANLTPFVILLDKPLVLCDQDKLIQRQPQRLIEKFVLSHFFYNPLSCVKETNPLPFAVYMDVRSNPTITKNNRLSLFLAMHSRQSLSSTWEGTGIFWGWVCQVPR